MSEKGSSAVSPGCAGGKNTPRGVWITRPEGQAAHLAARLAARGWEPIVAPLLAIEPRVDPVEASRWAEALDTFAWIFFVSANAARIGVGAIRTYRAWPPGPPVATVGAGSAATLRELGFPEVWYPRAGADSEAVLGEPWTQPSVIAGKRLLIVKGEGGRGLLAEVLRARGAELFTWSCYRRIPERWRDETWQPFVAGRIAALIVTSSEAAQILPQAMGASRFAAVCERLPAVVNHPRVAEALKRVGWREMAVAPQPGDEALVATLDAYFGRSLNDDERERNGQAPGRC